MPRPVCLYAIKFVETSDHFPVYNNWPYFFESNSRDETLDSQNNRAVAYLLGFLGVPADKKRARQLFEAGREQKHGPSVNNLGICAYYGEGGMPQDKRQALAFFQEASELGCLMGLVNLGRCYDFGDGCVLDTEQGEAHYRTAAHKGHLMGQYNLAISTFIRDTYTGYLMYAKLAEKQFLPAISFCLRSVRRGENTPYTLAWCKKIAKVAVKHARDYSSFGLMVAEIYHQGLEGIIDQNIPRAIELYEWVLSCNPESMLARTGLMQLKSELVVSTSPWITGPHKQQHIQEIRDLIPSLPDVLVELIVDYNVFLPKIGDRVDALDTFNQWMSAHILDVVLEPYPKYWISYDGWSPKWSEWVHLHTGRIMPLGSNEYWCNDPDKHPLLAHCVQEVLQKTHGKYSQDLVRRCCLYVQQCQQPLSVSNVMASFVSLMRDDYLSLLAIGCPVKYWNSVKKLWKANNFERLPDYLTYDQISRLQQFYQDTRTIP